MKWCSFQVEGEQRVGVVAGEFVYDVSDQLHTTSLLEVIAREFEPDVDLDVAPRTALTDVTLVAAVAASRAAMLSSAAQTVIMSRISALVLRTMKIPRLGAMRTRPSCSSWARGVLARN